MNVGPYAGLAMEVVHEKIHGLDIGFILLHNVIGKINCLELVLSCKFIFLFYIRIRNKLAQVVGVRTAPSQWERLRRAGEPSPGGAGRQRRRRRRWRSLGRRLCFGIAAVSCTSRFTSRRWNYGDVMIVGTNQLCI